MLTERATTTTAATTDDSPTATNIGVVNDWLREGWKDVHMDWLLLRQEVGMAQAQLQESYLHGTHEVRRLVSEGKEQGQHQLKRKWQVIQHHQQRLLQEDVPQLVALGKSFKTILLERRRGEESTPSTTTTTSTTTDTTAPHTTDTTTPTREFFHQAIRDFETTLRDPLFLHKLNTEIIPDKLSSCQEMIQYYQQRPELYDYTLTKELSRMNYTVFTEGGQKLTHEAAIREYAAKQQQQQRQQQEQQTSHPDYDHGGPDILWKAANQSLFGDVITSLTRENNDGLIRPLFHTASLVNDISMTIDFGRDAPHITAECYLQVIVPGGGGGYHHDDDEREESNKEAEVEKLVLAGALLAVYFCPVKHRMEATILHISPAPLLTDDHVERVATSLAAWHV
jgi:hypothetical protein